MKKLLFISILAAGYSACLAQLSNPSPIPRYATGGNTGASVNYGYIEYAATASPAGVTPVVKAIPNSGTINVSLNKTFTTIVFDSVPVNLIIQMDTVGFSYNSHSGPDSVRWIKPNFYYPTWQCDQVTFIFRGSKVQYHNISWGALFWNNLSGDTLHVPQATRTGGGASATFIYNYGAGANVLQSWSNW